MVTITRRRAALAVILVGIILVAIGLLLWLRSKPSSPPSSTKPIISSGGFPSPPTGSTSLRVKVLELGIDLPVVSGDGWTVGLFEAASYPGMKLPGQGGKSLLYAHARPGMFGPLFNARVGEHVEVDRPGQPPLQYTIQQYFGHWPANDTRILDSASHEQLVLLTCTTYNANDPRIVAIAEPN